MMGSIVNMLIGQGFYADPNGYYTKTSGNYINGKKDGKWTTYPKKGAAIYEEYANGVLKSTQKGIDMDSLAAVAAKERDLEQFPNVTFTPLKGYRDDWNKKQGTWTIKQNNGKRSVVVNFKDDIPDGDVKEFNPLCSMSYTFKNGKIVYFNGKKTPAAYPDLMATYINSVKSTGKSIRKIDIESVYAIERELNSGSSTNHVIKFVGSCRALNENLNNSSWSLSIDPYSELEDKDLRWAKRVNKGTQVTYQSWNSYKLHSCKLGDASGRKLDTYVETTKFCDPELQQFFQIFKANAKCRPFWMSWEQFRTYCNF